MCPIEAANSEIQYLFNQHLFKCTLHFYVNGEPLLRKYGFYGNKYYTLVMLMWKKKLVEINY